MQTKKARGIGAWLSFRRETVPGTASIAPQVARLPDTVAAATQRIDVTFSAVAFVSLVPFVFQYTVPATDIDNPKVSIASRNQHRI